MTKQTNQLQKPSKLLWGLFLCIPFFGLALVSLFISYISTGNVSHFLDIFVPYSLILLGLVALLSLWYWKFDEEWRAMWKKVPDGGQLVIWGLGILVFILLYLIFKRS